MMMKMQATTLAVVSRPTDSALPRTLKPKYEPIQMISQEKTTDFMKPANTSST